VFDFFGAMRTRDRVNYHKPHPEPYLRTCEDLGIAPWKAIAFVDSSPGVQSAKAAGLYVIAVPNTITRSQDLSLADEVLDSLTAFELGVLRAI
jgi:putative hydrolase of the HAD superfamily